MENIDDSIIVCRVLLEDPLILSHYLVPDLMQVEFLKPYLILPDRDITDHMVTNTTQTQIVPPQLAAEEDISTLAAVNQAVASAGVFMITLLIIG